MSSGTMEEWDLLEHEPRAPWWNMACDEWLLRSAWQRPRPMLRLYAWDRPSVSIGYFQEYPEARAATCAVVRRPTGGGLVPHGRDLTFTVALAATHTWWGAPVLIRYRKIHERVAWIFEQRGRSVGLSMDAPGKRGDSIRGAGRSICFDRPSPYDVLVHGRKVAGGAQRVTREGLLHQGSIQDGNESRVTTAEIIRAWESFGAKFSPCQLSPDEESAVSELVSQKFATEAWNRRVV